MVYYPMYMVTMCSSGESGGQVFEKESTKIFKLVLLQDLALNCWRNLIRCLSLSIICAGALYEDGEELCLLLLGKNKHAISTG